MWLMVSHKDFGIGGAESRRDEGPPWRKPEGFSTSEVRLGYGIPTGFRIPDKKSPQGRRTSEEKIPKGFSTSEVRLAESGLPNPGEIPESRRRNLESPGFQNLG